MFGLFCGGMVVLLVVTFGSLGLLLVETFRARSAARTLAADPAAGVRSLAAQSSGSRIWYGGEHNGRAFALRVAGLPTGNTGEGQRWQIVLAVVMEVRVGAPLGIKVIRLTNQKKQPSDFDDAFQHDGADALSPAARDAMLSFVQEGYRHRRRRDFVLSWGTGSRDLRLIDRSVMSSGMMADDVLADTHTILVHHHRIPNLTADTLRPLLNDMAVVADAVERGIGEE